MGQKEELLEELKQLGAPFKTKGRLLLTRNDTPVGAFPHPDVATQFALLLNCLIDIVEKLYARSQEK